MRALCFVLVGLLALAAAILILLYLAKYIILFIIAKHYISAAILGIIFFMVMVIINYITGDYHGELG